MKTISIVALLIFCCLASLCCHPPREADVETASITGRAVLYDGQPVHGAEVSVSHTDVLSTTTTDQDGRFTVLDLPTDQKLRIAVTKLYPGKELYSAGVDVTLASGEARQLPDLKGGRMPPPVATPENAHLLE